MISTTVKFAFREGKLVPGRVGEGADPVGQDSIAEALACVSEHQKGIAPSCFVNIIFNDAAWRIGNAESGELWELAVRTDMWDWGTSTWNERYGEGHTQGKVVQELDSKP
jgi:hypothetical protein